MLSECACVEMSAGLNSRLPAHESQITCRVPLCHRHQPQRETGVLVAAKTYWTEVWLCRPARLFEPYGGIFGAAEPTNHLDLEF